MEPKCMELKVVNSSTVLMRVIQVIKRKRINIRSLIAEENRTDLANAKIKITVEADADRTKLLSSQLKKIIDVIALEVI